MSILQKTAQWLFKIVAKFIPSRIEYETWCFLMFSSMLIMSILFFANLRGHNISQWFQDTFPSVLVELSNFTCINWSSFLLWTACSCFMPIFQWVVSRCFSCVFFINCGFYLLVRLSILQVFSPVCGLNFSWKCFHVVILSVFSFIICVFETYKSFTKPISLKKSHFSRKILS